MHRLAVLWIACAVALPAAAGYNNAQALFDAMLKAQRDRAEGVSDYIMVVDLMSHPSRQFYERASEDAADASSMELFRLVPQTEVRTRLKKQGKDVGPDAPGFAANMMRGMPGAAAGSSQGTPSWASAGAEVDPAELMQRARIVGEESIGGRSATVVLADGLDLKQKSDGMEFTINSMTIWVDTDNLVMLKTRMDGQITEKGQSRKISIERLDQDHRIVSGSRMILPYRTVMRMEGMVGPEQQKELEQAQVQLAEMEQQMASMPADQRKMMESRMGPQIAMMQSMAEDGSMVLETVIREIHINQGLEGALVRNPDGASGGAAMWKAAMQPVGTAPVGTAPVETGQDGQSLEQARKECLERKVAEAQAKKKKKKRFGKLLGSIGRIAGRHGGTGMASEISRATAVASDVNATSEDLESAAEALGISEEDVVACQNPQQED